MDQSTYSAGTFEATLLACGGSSCDAHLMQNTENSAIVARTALTGTRQDLDAPVPLVVSGGTENNDSAKLGRWTVPGLSSRATVST
jgi:hypothetical protein